MLSKVYARAKNFKPRSFKEGDPVLERISSKDDPRGIFKPNFEGLYVVLKVFL